MVELNVDVGRISKLATEARKNIGISEPAATAALSKLLKSLLDDVFDDGANVFVSQYIRPFPMGLTISLEIER
jgi:hypothetical protein